MTDTFDDDEAETWAIYLQMSKSPRPCCATAGTSSRGHLH